MPIMDAPTVTPIGRFAHVPGTPYVVTGAPDMRPASPPGQWHWIRLAFAVGAMGEGNAVWTFTPEPSTSGACIPLPARPRWSNGRATRTGTKSDLQRERSDQSDGQ